MPANSRRSARPPPPPPRSPVIRSTCSGWWIAERLVEPAPLEQWLDARLAPAELHVQALGLLRAAARKQRVAEALAVGALEPAVLLEPLDRVGVEDLAPDVGVVAGRIAA